MARISEAVSRKEGQIYRKEDQTVRKPGQRNWNHGQILWFSARQIIEIHHGFYAQHRIDIKQIEIDIYQPRDCG